MKSLMNHTTVRTFAALAALLLTAGLAHAEDEADVTWEDFYTVESIDGPEGVVLEVGGLDVLDDGRVAVAFERGEVFIYDPETEEWSQFADGLHDPLGLVAVSETELVVSQRPEVTRLRDTDGDGVADHYETLTDDFGMSGNYHEFHFGPVRDEEGNFYFSLGTASSGAGVREEKRGEFNPDGRPGRMYSAVPYRGWVMKVTPDGETTPFAPGFRTPNGLGFDAEGRLFVTDNEGDWVGTSPLFHVEQGNFYGHVASMLWTEGWDHGPPVEMPEDYFAERRTRPAVEFPHGILGNSPTQPLADTTGGKFGPFTGQMFIGEMNHSRLIRVALEEVHGKLQGAAFPFTNGYGNIRRGNNRLAFDQNGHLWTGQTHREKNWTGSTGLHRIRWTGRTPFEVERMSLTERGFELTFTRPIDPAVATDAANYEFVRYAYSYDRPYGSSQKYRREIAVTGVELSDDGKRVELVLEDLQPGFIYELQTENLRGEQGLPLMHPWMMYTVSVLRDGTKAPAVLPTPPMVMEDAEGGIFEAEEADHTHISTSNQHEGFTGSGYADYQDGNGAKIRWKIDVPEAGRYTLRFRYAMGAAGRPLRIDVNGETVADPLEFPQTEEWDDWQTTDTQAELDEGENIIEAVETGQSGGNIDHLELIHRD